MQSHGLTWRRIWGFLRRLSVSNYPNWNAGAWLHIPHRGSTWEHSVPSVRTQTDPASHGQVCFSRINANDSSRWTVRMFLCRMLLCFIRVCVCVDPAGSNRVCFFLLFLMQVLGYHTVNASLWLKLMCSEVRFYSWKFGKHTEIAKLCSFAITDYKQFYLTFVLTWIFPLYLDISVILAKTLTDEKCGFVYPHKK